MAESEIVFSPVSSSTVEEASTSPGSKASSPSWTYSPLDIHSTGNQEPSSNAPRRHDSVLLRNRPKSDSDILAELQAEVLRLRAIVSDKDEEISKLNDRVGDLELKLDTVITQNELLLAARTSDCAIAELNEIGEAVRKASDDTVAASAEIEQNIKDDASAPSEQVRSNSVPSARSMPALERSGRSLDHATKGRASRPSRPKSKRESSIDSSKSMESAAKKTSSPVQAVAPETPHESACPTQEQTEEEQKSRKIFGMGGVNPLLGMDPTAMMSQLRAGRLSRSQSTDQVTEAATAQGSEEDVRTWIYTTLNEPVPESDLQPLLKDGQVLCRLINAVRPSSSPVKVNTGKFAFCAMENLNSYLGAATATFGIPRLFEPADVQAGGTFNAVLDHLATLEKKVKS